jgi:hypothetical protein
MKTIFSMGFPGRERFWMGDVVPETTEDLLRKAKETLESMDFLQSKEGLRFMNCPAEVAQAIDGNVGGIMKMDYIPVWGRLRETLRQAVEAGVPPTLSPDEAKASEMIARCRTMDSIQRVPAPGTIPTAVPAGVSPAAAPPAPGVPPASAVVTLPAEPEKKPNILLPAVVGLTAALALIFIPK